MTTGTQNPYPAVTSGGQVRWEDTPNRHAYCDAEIGRLRARAEKAEARLAEIRGLCQRRSAPIFADILAITGTEEATGDR